jgi:hypothetical protein
MWVCRSILSDLDNEVETRPRRREVSIPLLAIPSAETDNLFTLTILVDTVLEHVNSFRVGWD